jgi:hypothetical protein
MDLFYRRGDGFTTLIKHPTLPPEAIEEIQRSCFEEDFRRLGPSIFRVLEVEWLGWRKLKDSPNPALRAKAEFFARQLRVAYPVFLAGRLFGPNAAVRRWIGDLERSIHADLGRPTWGERAMSAAALGAAAWTALTLRMNWFQHPRLIRTAYRLPDERWGAFEMWERLHRKVSPPGFSVRVELQHAKRQVWMRLEGAPSANDADGLAVRLQESLARSGNRLVLDLKGLQWDKATDLAPLREKLANHRSRIRVVLPRLSAAHPELVLLAGMFHLYRG